MVLWLVTPLSAWAANDPPQFTTYKIPGVKDLSPRAEIWAWCDVGLLALALGLAAWLALKRRSRTGLYLLMLACLAYFGFYKEGCVCPVGSLQNVVQGLFDPTASLPVPVLLIFLLPLVAALLFGRVFCAAVCPLGAMQDALLVKPLTVPRWLEMGLGILAYAYLALAVLLAASGAAYIVCQFDPIVPIFRLGGSHAMVTLAILIALLSLVVGRPYCRFLCPYGVLLRLCSAVSQRHLRIYPDACIQCRLCEKSCPFEAIRPATPEGLRPPKRSRWLLVGAVLAVPLLTIGLGWLGASLAGPLSRLHRDVKLADRLHLEQTAVDRKLPVSDISDYFKIQGGDPDKIAASAHAVHGRLRTGGWIVGALLGLLLGGRILALVPFRRRKTYEPERGACYSCGRCFAYCPGAACAPVEDSGDIHAASRPA